MLLDLKERLSAGIFFQLRALLSNKDRGYQAVKKGAQATDDREHQKNKVAKIRQRKGREQMSKKQEDGKKRKGWERW